jgi:hypothetical protein
LFLFPIRGNRKKKLPPAKFVPLDTRCLIRLDLDRISLPITSADTPITGLFILLTVPCLLTTTMTDDGPAGSSASSRPKPSRTATTAGTVRARAGSPPPGQSGEGTSDGRPPAKRARKAINCEPCRNSKLKCDRYGRSVAISALANRCTWFLGIAHVLPVYCGVCVRDTSYVYRLLRSFPASRYFCDVLSRWAWPC